MHRSTPASAGRTDQGGLRRVQREEHPHGSGEDAFASIVMCPTAGSPPRRRGGLQRLVAVGAGARITPAAAGRTRRSPGRCGRTSDHPRGGGEDPCPTLVQPAHDGSPPRRRGGRWCGRRRCRGRRITPAAAGRTHRPSRPGAPGADHPRGGGEDSVGQTSSMSASGSPPRRRGGPSVSCALGRGLLGLYPWGGCHADEGEAVEVCRNAAASPCCADGVALLCGSGMDEDCGAVADGFCDGLPELVAYTGRDSSDEDAGDNFTGPSAQGATQVVRDGCCGDAEHGWHQASSEP